MDEVTFLYKFSLHFDNKFKGARKAHREIWKERIAEPLRKSIKKLGADVTVVMGSDSDQRMQLTFRWSSDHGDWREWKQGAYESPEKVTGLLLTKYMNRQFRCGEAGTIRCNRITCDVGRY